MAKEYYTLEEAANVLGMSAEEVQNLRENGTLRGFSDAGSWKFRVAEVDQLAAEASGQSKAEDEDEDLILLTGEQGEQPIDPGAATELGGEGPTEPTPADSDVRLVGDQSGGEGSDDSGVKLAEAGQDSPTDSDVRLIGEERPEGAASGSADSDVRMVSDSAAGSGDSGVQFVEDTSSSADSAEGLDLTEPPSAPSPADSDITLAEMPAEASESDFGSGDSGVALSTPADSGISLEASDAEDWPQASDSEVALTEEDSGPSFESSGDSDIGLSGLGEEADAAAATSVGEASAASDAGTSDSGASDSGLKDIFDDTDFEVTALEEDIQSSSSEETAVPEETTAVSPEAGAAPAEAESGSEVVALEGEEVADESAATVMDEGEGAAVMVEEEEGEEEVAAEALMSQPSLPSRVAASAPVPSMLVTAGLVLTTVLLVFGGLFVFELFRNQFSAAQDGPGQAYLSPVLDQILDLVGLGGGSGG